MATKDHCLLTVSGKTGNKQNSQQHQNLNLNEFVKSKCIAQEGSLSISTNNKQRGSDKQDSNDERGWQKSVFSDKWNAKVENPRNLLLGVKKDIGGYHEGDDPKSSTLSLHIAAYENSVKDAEKTKSSNIANTRKKEVKPSLKEAFELPRQMDDSSQSNPEVMQFKASQQLLNVNPSASNDAETSSSSQKPSTFISWCKDIVEKFNADESGNDEEEEERRNQFINFLENNFNEGKTYKSIVRRLISYSLKDKGVLCKSFLETFTKLFQKFGASDKHWVHLVSNLLIIFENEELEGSFCFDIEVLFKETVAKLTKEIVDAIFTQVFAMFVEGELVKKRSIILFMYVSGLQSTPMDNTAILTKLLNESSYLSTDGIVSVICDDNKKNIVYKYAEDFVQVVLKSDAAIQKLGYAKILSCVPLLDEIGITAIFKAICEAWNDKEKVFFKEISTDIIRFIHMCHRHPNVGKALLKLLKKDKQLVYTSLYGIIVQIGLMSSFRFEDEASKIMAHLLSKIWEYAGSFEEDPWMKTMLGEMSLKEILSKVDFVIEIMKENPEDFALFTKGLTVLAMKLIKVGAKKARLNVLDGKLEQPENDICFVGRRIMVETLLSSSIDITKKETLEPLEALVNAIISNASNVPTIYFYIDILLELRNKNSTLLVMNYDVFAKITKNIVNFAPDPAEKVVAALMPVIMQREGLRNEIFESLKSQMVSPNKATVLLPIIFNLLRSYGEKPEAQTAFQSSQSFATFSSQLSSSKQPVSSIILNTAPLVECIKRSLHQSPSTRCTVYKEVVNLCKKSNAFVVQALDFLIAELEQLPELKLENYIATTGNASKYLKFQSPQLLKATFSSLTAASKFCINLSQEAPASQIGGNLVGKGENILKKVVNKVLGASLDELRLDKASMTNQAANVEENKLFGSMVVLLYNVCVECIWNFNVEEDNEQMLLQIETLIQRQKELWDALNQKIKPTKAAKSSNAGEKEVDKPKKVQSLNLISKDVEIDISKFPSMFKDLDLPMFENRRTFEGAPSKQLLMRWLICRAYDSISLLDSSSTTSLASLTSLTSVARCLLEVWFNNKPGDAEPDVVDEIIDIQVKATIAYSKILVYVVTKYRGKCSAFLKDIFENVITNYNWFSTTQAKIDVSDAGGKYSEEFYTFAAKHVFCYFLKLFPAVFTARGAYELVKRMTDYRQQISAILNAGRILVPMLTASSDAIRLNVFLPILDITKSYDMGDMHVTLQFWQIVMEIISQSNGGAQWIKILHELIDSMNVTLEPEKVNRYFNNEFVPQLYVLIGQTISCLITRIRTAILIKHEFGHQIDEECIISLMCSAETFGGCILKMIKVENAFANEKEQMIRTSLEMLINYYTSLFAIVEEFNAKGCVFAKKTSDALQVLSRIIVVTTNDILKLTANKYGSGSLGGTGEEATSTTTDPAKIAKKIEKENMAAIKRNQRDGKIFERYEKSFETFHSRLLILEKSCSTEEARLILDAAADKALRVFRFDSGAMKRRFDNQHGSGDEESEDSEEEESGELGEKSENEDEVDDQHGKESSDDSDDNSNPLLDF